MTDAFTIDQAMTEAHLRATAALFEAYAASLPIDLAYQDFAGELAGLPGYYAPPRGALLLARAKDEAPIGCIGLRPLPQEGCCEMKRLFVLPDARGLGLGRALARAAIDAAHRIGYRELRLDTLETMTAALALYAQLGFSGIAPYYAPMPRGTLFMARRL